MRQRVSVCKRSCQESSRLKTLFFLKEGALRCKSAKKSGRVRPLLDRGDGLVDGRGHIVDVLGGQTAHVDTAAGHQVDVFLLHHELHLFGCGKKKTTERR